MQEFWKKDVLQALGQPANVTCPTWAWELGEAWQHPSPRLLLPAGSLRGPTGKPLMARYLQLNPALGPWFPPCFLLPCCPQHLSTEIVPSLKLESTNRSQKSCGTWAGGKDRHCVQDWGDWDGQVPRGVPQEDGTGKNSLQVARYWGGKGRTRTAWRAGIWDWEPSQQLDKALWTGTGQG